MDDTIKAGYFQHTNDSEELRKKNTFTFIEFKNAQQYRTTGDKKYVTEVKGDDLKRVFYPKLVTAKYDQVFTINANDTITPKIPVKFGGLTMSSGSTFSNSVFVGGVNLFDYKGKNLEGYVDNGIFVIYRILV